MEIYGLYLQYLTCFSLFFPLFYIYMYTFVFFFVQLNLPLFIKRYITIFFCSKGRSGHIPYRDSKLTRILQNSLGGNGRTAIICTMSPALSHVEQSRNTLLFASCAKEVSTNAQVNVVMSEKVLVKHLQRELARLQLELRTAGSASDSATLLREKELMIEQVFCKTIA